MKPTTGVLFVCLGNICRSPAAEGVMRHMVEQKGLSDRITCDSAGTYGGHTGELPDPRMRRAAAARGYDLTHRARQFRTGDFDRFDMIIVMDDSNYENVSRMAPSLEAARKIHRMTDFCSREKRDIRNTSPKCDISNTSEKRDISNTFATERPTHIPDPYYEGAEGFENVLDLLEDACDGLLQEFS
ncbi:MAG: low molecular weight phosphotyrosine protein phosphatase [Alistipes sp.]|nr:low molecular weight phosphotyrosine protein phosphatase [Alistipes sp.]